MTTLYLLRGMPGSGKSTLAKELVRSGIALRHYEADQYFIELDWKTGKFNYNFDPTKLGAAHLQCQENVREALSFGESVVVSNTSTTDREVKVYEDLAKEYEAKFVSIVVERRHDGKSIHEVPQEKMQAMHDRFTVRI